MWGRFSGYNHHPWKSWTEQLRVHLLLMFWLTNLYGNTTCMTFVQWQFIKISSVLLTSACLTMIKHLLCSIFTALLVPYYPLELKMLFMATCRDREEQESAAASQPPMKELNPTASHSSTVDVLAICGGKKCQECSEEGFLACFICKGSRGEAVCTCCVCMFAK